MTRRWSRQARQGLDLTMPVKSNIGQGTVGIQSSMGYALPLAAFLRIDFAGVTDIGNGN
jgi:hypothetical protein